MPGRQSQDNEPWDKYSSQRLAAYNGNGTGKQRAVPQRPPRMSRVDRPPNTPRVARPQRQEQKPKNRRKRLLIWIIAFVVCALLACGIGFAAVNYFQALGASQGPANTTTDFVSSLQGQSYAHAFNDLAPTLTIQMTPQQFQQQAQEDDQCYGPVTDYSEVGDSATTSTDGKTQTYIYNITRTLSGKARTYQMHIALQQDSSGTWRITSYSPDSSTTTNDLGPGQPPCS